MKNLKFYLTLLGIIVLAALSCKKDISNSSNYHLGEPFSLKANEAVSLIPVDSVNSSSDSILSVTFKKVIYDTRCPFETCYLCYGSSAKIEVLLTYQKETATISLTIPGCREEFSCDDQLYYRKDTLGYRICFLRLDPYPIGNVTINPSNYIAKLNISKL